MTASRVILLAARWPSAKASAAADDRFAGHPPGCALAFGQSFCGGGLAFGQSFCGGEQRHNGVARLAAGDSIGDWIAKWGYSPARDRMAFDSATRVT